LYHVEDVVQAYFGREEEIEQMIRDAARKELSRQGIKSQPRQEDIEQMIRDAARTDNKTSLLVHLALKREKIKKRIQKLRKRNGRDSCLLFSRSCANPITITGDETDINPWLLGCKNGVLDLRSGDFRDGRYEDMITKACPTEWKGYDTPCDEFIKWLMEIFEDNSEIVSFIQRALGYAITGLNTEHFLLVLTGQGRNGKGTLVEILTYVLGSIAGAIQSEMLLANKNSKNTAGPSPDIMGLKGMRLAFASETDDGQRFSPSRVKWLTGGDELVGRAPHDKYETRFKPTHTLILLTNHVPHVSPDDFAFWERIFLIPFNLSFVKRTNLAPNERPAIPGLADKLKKEACGVLAWLVKGCLLYQKHGLNPPEKITSTTNEFRRKEDLLADFIDEMCHVSPDASVRATDIYDKFKTWYEENISKKYPISQKRFGEMMGRRFEKRKTSGNFYYDGVGINVFGL